MSLHPVRRLTGRHVLMIARAAFGTVVAANLAMLLAATGSFPGLVVQNSYVASQRWDRAAAAQQVLGWRARAAWRDGRLVVSLLDAGGRPVEGAAIEATIGRPSAADEDRTLALAFADGGYAAPVELAPGGWRVDIRTVAGPDFAFVDRLHVPEPR